VSQPGNKKAGRLPGNVQVRILWTSTKRGYMKLNWTIKEYVGCEIFKQEAPQSSLINEDDLKEGDQIICYSWLLTVKKNEDGELYGENKQLYAILDFSKDDRKCWVCGGIINLRGIKNANKNTIVG
jgi:hypothetical protein